MVAVAYRSNGGVGVGLRIVGVRGQGILAGVRIGDLRGAASVWESVLPTERFGFIALARFK